MVLTDAIKNGFDGRGRALAFCGAKKNAKNKGEKMTKK